LTEASLKGAEVRAAAWSVLLECASPMFDSRRLAAMLREKPNWPALTAIAEQHGATGLLAERIRKLDESCVPREILQKLREKRKAQVLFSMSLNAELFRLLEKFSAVRVEAIVVKGPVLSARAYGDPGMRRYEDVDLLVRHKDILRFTELLTAEGYEPKVSIGEIQAGKIPGEYLFKWPGTVRRIELHTEMTLRYFPRRLPVEKLFARRVYESIDGHGVPALATEDELVLVCVHNAKHFWEQLTMVADVAALIARRKDLDWGRAMSTARELGAERMLILGLRLEEQILRVKTPEKMEKIVRSDRGAERLAGEIIKRLPSATGAQRGVIGRALFRMRMRGGFIGGAAYLLRLTLSPTEEDWKENSARKPGRILEALQRPLRLTRKYRGKNEG
jgi:putative nucleotidyltransferase-like protein